MLDASIGFSCVEIYGTEINDLLDGGKAVGQSRVAASKYVLDGENMINLKGVAHAHELLDLADSQKRRAATAMNERSSRAHSIVILSLEQTHRASGKKLSSKLFLADLGGSEQVKKSKVSGEEMKQAIFINQGLFALGKCVDALNEKSSHVPYQNSKLTMLLAEALGGDSKTTIVVTAGAEDAHALETLQAMRFGERCMAVTNQADIGMSGMTAALQALDKEIQECDEFIRVNERWENRVETVYDERAGLHVDDGESLEKAGKVLEQLSQRDGVGIEKATAALRDWIATVEAMMENGAGAEGEDAMEETDEDPEEKARERARAAVENVKAAAEWLKDHGSPALGQDLEDMVVAKVQDTADQAVQTKLVTVLVGAEDHRARLEELLKRRKLLTGK
eukprot:TRINITY_DN8929_c0_g1_i3.p1 TRINITY_DN8929_c0_g1~~TRINITY_DN8929_c0_g1_i3.p1  ORF type:complete len:394 (-),score=113.10 TRINITY_DN8929_c0_g1_i3:225-1406(-)